MFNTDFSTHLFGTRLHIDYFSGVVVVDDMNEEKAAEYLKQQLKHLEEVKNKMKQEIEKYESS